MPELIDALDSIIESASKAAEVKPAAVAPAALKEGAGNSAAPLEELGSYEGDQIDPQIIFAGEGQRLNTKRTMSPKYAVRLAEVATGYKRVISGRASLARWFTESMVSADFPVLLGDTLDRLVLTAYATYAPTYTAFMRRRTVRDFRSVGSVRRHGGSRLSEIRQATDYKYDALSESSLTYAVKKWGKLYKLTWEMIRNDDTDAFASLPGEMAEDARQTEMYYLSSLYVANATLFQAARGAGMNNKLTAALTIAAIETGVNTMVAFAGDGDNPLNNTPIYLVVPPVLRIKAFRELGVLNLAGTAGTVTLAGTTNVLAGELTIVVDPMIPILDPTNGNTSWYLFSDPNRLHAVEYAFLAGLEEPQIFMQSPNAIRLGGGGEDAMDGSFEDDSIGYKSRHVVGGAHTNATGGWKGCLWSDGST
ncbi:MAG: Mu-like prophage major head subunit gpT family protein [Anaerolineae bacterium]|nr:Mu-like prophage major head subunit gpT family protein [Anaerolineae bacterium]